MNTHQKSPLNVETKPSELVSHFITPKSLLFHRNHDRVPFDSGLTSTRSTLHDHLKQDEFKVQLSIPNRLKERLDCHWIWNAGSGSLGKDREKQREQHNTQVGIPDNSEESTLSLPLAQLKDAYDQQRIAATLECAGNRRSEFNQSEGENELDEDLKAEGIQWGGGVLGCCVWQGISLRSLLLDLGLKDPYSSTSPPTSASLESTKECEAWAASLHVHFFSAQESSEGKEVIEKEDKEEKERAQSSPGRSSSGNLELSHFGSSIPLSIALHPKCQILLAYGMNGEPLTGEHGYPLRVVAPGFVGARWVKWLTRMELREDESDAFAMQLDYKILEPLGAVRPRAAGSDEYEDRGEWLARVMGKGPLAETRGNGKDSQFREKLMRRHGPIMRMGVGSAIVFPKDGDKLKRGFKGKGYATGTDGSTVSKVLYLLVPNSLVDSSHPSPHQVREFASTQPSSSWKSACVLQPEEQAASKACGVSLQPGEKDESSDYSWAWRLWEIEFDGEESGTYSLVVKAETESGAEQECETPFNVRGFHQRSWPVVKNLSF